MTTEGSISSIANEYQNSVQRRENSIISTFISRHLGLLRIKSCYLNDNIMSETNILGGQCFLSLWILWKKLLPFYAKDWSGIQSIMQMILYLFRLSLLLVTASLKVIHKKYKHPPFDQSHPE